MPPHARACRLALPLLALLAARAPAHDYWLQPDTFFPAVGATVPVRLHVGDHLVSEAERPLQKKRSPGFRLLSARAAIDLAAPGKEGQKPVARPTFPAAGTYLVTMDRTPQLITLDARKFDAYLAEEGLEHVRAERRKRGEDGRPGRERYSRCLKALLRAGPRGDDTWKRVVGQRLEIVPLADPLGLSAGDKLPVRVLFEGNPLTGARVFALRRAGEKTLTQSATTSARGEAAFKMDGPGMWLVRLVHMRRAIGDAEADWESVWGSLSFAVR